MEALETAQLCAKYADDKKAEAIVLLDLRGLSPVTDYFVICTASSAPQLRAVRDEIVVQMREQHGLRPIFVDGSFESQWIIVNFPNVIVHVLSAEKREYYGLEDLWGDAKFLPWEPERPEPAAPVKKVAVKRVAKKAATKKTPVKKVAGKKAPVKKKANTLKSAKNDDAI